MEVHTGAAESINSDSKHRALWPDAELQRSLVALKIYTGKSMEVLGELLVAGA